MVFDDPSLASVGRLLPCDGALPSRDLDRFPSPRCVPDLSLLFVVAALDMGNGGKAQSRLVSSGEGGRRGPGTDPLRTACHGALGPGPEPALAGEAKELFPLLPGVSSPWYV